jgi:hypothetical protein
MEIGLLRVVLRPTPGSKTIKKPAYLAGRSPNTSAQIFTRTQSNQAYASPSASGNCIPQWGQ